MKVPEGYRVCTTLGEKSHLMKAGGYNTLCGHYVQNAYAGMMEIHNVCRQCLSRLPKDVREIQFDVEAMK